MQTCYNKPLWHGNCAGRHCTSLHREVENPLWDANCAYRTSTTFHNPVWNANCAWTTSTSLQELLRKANCACKISTRIHKLLQDGCMQNLSEPLRKANCAQRNSTNLPPFWRYCVMPTTFAGPPTAIKNHCGMLTSLAGQATLKKKLKIS